MAATNKCLAQMNKSPDLGQATNKRAANGHFTGSVTRAEYINEQPEGQSNLRFQYTQPSGLVTVR